MIENESNNNLNKEKNNVVMDGFGIPSTLKNDNKFIVQQPINIVNEAKKEENINKINKVETIPSEQVKINMQSQNLQEEVKQEVVEQKEETKPINNDFTVSYFDGKMLDLLGWNVLRIMLTIVTAGLGSSWGECLFLKYKLNHTVLNGKRLKFIGDGSELFVEQFKWNFLTLVTFGIYLFWRPVRKKEWIISNIYIEDEPIKKGCSFFGGKILPMFGINLLCTILPAISFGLLIPLAECIKLRWISKYTVINKCRIIFEGKALNLFLKSIGWGFLTIITFGIYGLWLPIKIINWEVENTVLVRPVN